MKKRRTPEASGPDDLVLDHLARNVETLREHHGWSLGVVAKRSGVPASLLKHIVHLRANPSVTDVLRLANAFGVQVGELTDRAWEGASSGETGARRYDPERFGAAFGGRLRAYRKRRGLLIRPLAALANIARNTLRSMEMSGVGPGTRTAARIAHAFGMSFGNFVESLHSSVLAFTASPPAPGRTARILLHDTSAGDLLCMEELSLRRGQAVQRPACGSGSTTMVYAIEGAVRIAFEAESVQLQSGEAALVASDRPFSLAAVGARTVRVLMVVRSADVELMDETP